MKKLFYLAIWIQEYDGRLNFATDAWTSPNHKAFVALTVHLEHEGKPLSMLLDIFEVPKSHTGENLAIAFAQVLELYGIKDKVRRVSEYTRCSYLPPEQILSLTTDNASNNDTMVYHLTEILDDFPGPANQTRCFVHTLSISAKAVIKQSDVPKADAGEALDKAVSALADMAQEIELEDRREQEAWVEDDDDEGEDHPLNAWEDFREGLSDEQRRELDVGLQPVRSMLAKVC